MPRIVPLENPCTIELDGTQLEARAGEPVAASIIASGELLFARSPKYHRPRGPWCLTGGCSQCLMRVDGVPNVATCQVPATPGMRLERQNALPDANIDLLRASDFFFRSWFNHHEFLAGVPIAEAVLAKVARQLSGLGLLPDRPKTRPPATFEQLGVVIVGAGAAGLALARRLHEAGRPFTLLEKDTAVGGRLISAAEAHQPAVWSPPADRVRTQALVVGLFADAGTPFLAVVERQHLRLIGYERLVITSGGQPAFAIFPNNDVPGVMAGRAVSTLIRRHGVLPGNRVACVVSGAGAIEEARALASLVTQAGGVALAVGAKVKRAHGLRRVEAVTVVEGQGEQKHSCEVIAVCGPVNPSFELARAAGARVSWDDRHACFVVEANAQGKTSAPGVWVAGEIRGPMSSGAAVEQGLTVAEAFLHEGVAP
jgi:sarcosine oxidase, subunit alpha